jgi:hypothetical protein
VIRLGIKIGAALAAFALVACTALKSAEKSAETVFNETRASADKFCASEAKLKADDLLKGKAAADADKFCEGVAFSDASSVSVEVATPAGSASVSIPAVGGAPGVAGAPAGGLAH